MTVRAARAVLLAAVVVVMAAGCTAEGIGGVTVITSGTHRIETGTRIPGAVVVAGGALVIEEGAMIDGDVLVGEGEVRVAGTVGGDVAAIGGRTRVDATGHVLGAARVGAAAVLETDRGGRIDGGVVEGFAVPDSPASAPVTELAWAVGRVLVALAVAVLLRLVLRGRVGGARRYLVGMPATSVSYGFLVGLVGLSLVVFMAFTIVLIPVALLAFLALGLALAIGLAAALDALVARFGRLRGWAVLAGGLLVVPSIPLVGAPVSVVAALAALGAGSLAFRRPATALPGGSRPPYAAWAATSVADSSPTDP